MQPICTPSRSQLLTGLYQVGIFDLHAQSLLSFLIFFRNDGKTGVNVLTTAIRF